MQQKELIQTVSNITSVSRSIVAEILKTTACVVAETLAEGEETEVKVPRIRDLQHACQRDPRHAAQSPGEQ
ncbi:HU family DNA-binding protein [Candidatus Accumulibacter contiguus]|jgi:nucleoid DNA-binding protein|uniref:HU family DNA-binding protein n=1 Tax=Candidatus Accumulibacter contiguus TaxID=2954381 RepID=UPI002FC282F1